jgi:hypothetical protein
LTGEKPCQGEDMKKKKICWCLSKKSEGLGVKDMVEVQGKRVAMCKQKLNFSNRATSTPDLIAKGF